MGFFNRCQHDWVKDSEHISESTMEQVLRLSGSLRHPSTINGLEQLTQKKHIVIMHCTKCGKLKKLVTKV